MASKKLTTPAAIDAKLAALHADNALATQDLSAQIGAERWERVIKQCEAQGMNVPQIESLCGKMRRTRREWHPNNEAAALASASIGLLIAIGSAPNDDDVKAFEATLAPLPGQSS
jgi:hypothetical protein